MPAEPVRVGRQERRALAATRPVRRRPEPGDDFPQAVPAGSGADEYLLPATWRGIAAHGAASLGILTGLWVALSPFFLVLQHDGGNATIANLIAGLAVAGSGVVAVASRYGFGSLQFGISGGYVKDFKTGSGGYGILDARVGF